MATFAGNLTGLVGTYLALLMVLLVSRIPFVERVLGQDGLLRWHRRLAPWPISLLVAARRAAHRRLRPGGPEPACGTRWTCWSRPTRTFSAPRSAWA